MISGFQAREIGLGLNELLVDAVIEAIHQKRKGTKYIASDDTQLINKSGYKEDIIDNPLLIFQPWYLKIRLLE